MSRITGASSGPGSKASPDAPTGHRPSGYDPSRECAHDFHGWREFEDGRGGERVCANCGLGAMAYTLSLDF